MARPVKTNVDYFPHDADASEKKTLTILFNRFGHEGISCWWQLLEKVSKADNHIISTRNPEDMEFLAAKLNFTPERFTEILNKMADLGAIDNELFHDGIIWSQNLVDRLAQVYKNRGQSLPIKPAVSTSNNEVSTNKNSINKPDNTQSKVNKTKVNNNIYAHFEIFWKAYPKKKSRVVAEKAFIKINPDEQLLATMLAKIERAKKSVDWSKDNGQYIPYPAAWLNQRRWEDEDEQIKPVSQVRKVQQIE